MEIQYPKIKEKAAYLREKGIKVQCCTEDYNEIKTLLYEIPEERRRNIGEMICDHATEALHYIDRDFLKCVSALIAVSPANGKYSRLFQRALFIDWTDLEYLTANQERI